MVRSLRQSPPWLKICAAGAQQLACQLQRMLQHSLESELDSVTETIYVFQIIHWWWKWWYWVALCDNLLSCIRTRTLQVLRIRTQVQVHSTTSGYYHQKCKSKYCTYHTFYLHQKKIHAWHHVAACLGGLVGWGTVRTDRNGLPEELGFNPR